MICDLNLCTGCGACENICPKQCIQLDEDAFGVVYPVIDLTACIQCDLCKRVCPQISKVKSNAPQTCYAAYLSNHQDRLDSASGGVAWLLYKRFLTQYDNAMVVWVESEAGGETLFSAVTEISQIEKYRGSKYVQASTQKIYLDIAQKLTEDGSVLFVGTPCQVAALYSFLKLKKIKTDNLYTVDLLCHGVSPQRYFKEQVNYLKTKYHFDSIQKISFRSNRKFQNYHFVIEATRKEKKITYNRYGRENPYFSGFLKGITLRESCYHCQYAADVRVGDLTIGDFIGLTEQKNSPPFLGNKNNASLVLCNTVQGIQLWDDVKDSLNFYERPFQEAYDGGASLQAPFERHPLRDEFLAVYQKDGFLVAADVIRKATPKVEQLKVVISRVIKQAVVKFL